MVNTYILPVDAGSGRQLFEKWWQWVLLSLALAAIAIGLTHIAFFARRKIYRFLSRKKGTTDGIPAKVASHLEKYTASRSKDLLEKLEISKPKSLGVYLGPFDKQISADQVQVLSENDAIILDPFQGNVVAALAQLPRNIPNQQTIIGRIDIGEILHADEGNTQPEDVMISGIDQLMTIIMTRFRDQDGRSNCFNGILLAGWEAISTPLLYALSDALSDFDLGVYLETSAPKFLSDSDILDCGAIRGLVIRNALVLENGERRDCFAMENLRMTVKGFVSQSCLRPFTVLIWDTLEDDAVVSNAVLKRTFSWCGFYSAVPWIGSRRSLYDASVKAVPSEPLSAFDWLKEPRVMELHEAWKSKRPAEYSHESRPVKGRIVELIPTLQDMGDTSFCKHGVSTNVLAPGPALYANSEWFILKNSSAGDPFCSSVTGDDLDGLGCFPLGIYVTEEDFQEVVFSQKKLRKLDLLDIVNASDLQAYGETLTRFLDETDLLSETTVLGAPCSPDLVGSLAKTLSFTPDEGAKKIRVYLGLHSGFQKTVNKQFWATYHVYHGNTDIYISKETADVVGTLLHAYLSSRGLTRHQCLAAEISFGKWQKTLRLPHELSPRLMQDISSLTPDEALSLLQRISLTPGMETDELLRRIKSGLMEALIDIPTLNQLKSINTAGYISGDVDVQKLVATRLQWHCQSKRSHPELSPAMDLFRDVEAKVLSALKNRDRRALSTIVEGLEWALDGSAIGPFGDIFTMAVFSTMRKLAFEEVYIEVTDRNPLFNDQPDQAAAFAELFALGSRCEAYFDVTPSQFGRLLSTKFRDYYGTDEHQPPVIKDTQAALDSVYSEAQMDVDPDQKAATMPTYQRFTFLSVFAIPALIDIVMLTTTGHGLYLSGMMTDQEQHSATVALMISLLLSGAIGTWITCGGTYYLASMAFSAMNYFVVTRLLGGFAFTMIVALIGFFAFLGTSTFHEAIVFLLYLIALTTYLCLLAALANYQFTGSGFQSGRTIIILCIPVLFVSPLITIFVPRHDIYVYLVVLYVFIFLLLLGVRRTGSRWTTWYQKLFLLDNVALRSWYIDQLSAKETESIEKMADSRVLIMARQKVQQAVRKEQRKSIFSRQKSDPLILKLVRSYEATRFLMDWYCRFTGVPKPIMYSSSWNVTTKVALDSLQKSQLGIRFHNGFIHWRQAGDEIGCTMLYFIVALLDKWVGLIDGGHVLGLGSSQISLRTPVGFGLAYYLVGAVLLDFNATKLHELAGEGDVEIVPTDADIENAAKIKFENRKLLYWKTLSRYLFWHVWGLAVTSVLVWIFAKRAEEAIIFMSYVGAYTGLLWYQYTKIFAGPHALKPLLVGVAVGLPVGFALERTVRDFNYADVIALASATWTVAILSLFASKIVGKPEIHLPRSARGTYHAYSGLGPEQSWSQTEIKGLYEQIEELPRSERLHVLPDSSFGQQLSQILTRCQHTKLRNLADRAFPEAAQLLSLSKALFNEGQVKVELVSSQHFSKYDYSMRAVSNTTNTNVNLIVGCDTRCISRGRDPLPGFFQEVVELLIRIACERYIGLAVRDSVLAQNLSLIKQGGTVDSSPPLTLERQLKINTQAENPSALLDLLRKQLLKDLCLGIDPDLEWEKMSVEARQYLVKRCIGIASPPDQSLGAMIASEFNLRATVNFETHVARSNYAAFLSATWLAHATSWISEELSSSSYQLTRVASMPVLPVIDLHENTLTSPRYSTYDQIRVSLGNFYHYLGILCKFFSIAFVADPEYQREVKHQFPGATHPFNFLVRGFLLAIWMWSKRVQQLLLPTFLFHNRSNVATVWQNIQGMQVNVKRRRVLIRNSDGVYTGFIKPADSSGFKLLQYKGDHKSEPTTENSLCAINTYSNTMALQRREEMSSGKTTSDYIYDYRQTDATVPKRISKHEFLKTPITRRAVAGANGFESVDYNSQGNIESGSYLKDGNLVRFQYQYQKSAKHNGALLRAKFVLPHLSCTVSWCAPPRRKPERLDTWIPHSQVTEAVFIVDADIWESKFIYDHKYHPTINTTLNGQKVDTPPLILYDHLNVLKRPVHISIVDDNPLFGFTTTRFNPLTRALGLSTRKYLVPTLQTRSWLWKAWKQDPAFDGVIVRWLDERLLRRDPVLKPYWRKRDLGNLTGAEEYLDENRDAVMASVDLDNSISSMTPLAIKINDLYSFGQGGDAVSRTRSNITAQEEDETQLHVIAVDTGTWPNEGGGVSACRSDVVNNLRTIKWHMVAESANDFGLPKRQIERNVHSLKIIPLWGLDLMTPTHGLFVNRLDSQVEHITTHATLLDIERAFVPILEAMIMGARAIEYSVADIKQMTRALVNLNSYFKDTKHWSETWRSEVVKSAWRRLWLSQTAENARPSSQWLKTELPTLGQLDQGLEIWSRYLFIMAIPIPEKMPAVFQTSHHSVSASYGVLCKIKRGCTLQIWDHAISWRETNLYLSSALCPLAPFVRNSLLGLMRMTSVLTLHHADTILPCADFFNPNWEVEIGTCQGQIEHRSAFRRKIDPVVNGITNIERFTPVKEIKSKTPTVTMLSHVWFAKDIKTALLSADVIINKYGFRDFRLDIYGTIDKAPSYTTQCQEIIATKSLRHQVKLQGEADALSVLEKTWVFLNSSVSEGLPLALGEAALTGAPVVCTDVGASLRVLTNPKDGACYSAVVAPNDALAVARAQIKLLALLGEWAQYEDPTQPTRDSSFPDDPTPEDVARITKRMYEQHDARRALGMRTRTIVQKSFSGDRYLREHEQMLWIGKARNDMTCPGSLPRPSTSMMPVAEPVHVLNRESAFRPPVAREFRGSGGESVSTLDVSNPSTAPTIVENIVPTITEIALDEGMWLEKPPRTAVRSVEKGLRRETRSVSPVVGDNMV